MPYHIYFGPTLEEAAEEAPGLTGGFRLGSVALGVNLVDCIDGDFDRMLEAVTADLGQRVAVFAEVVDEVLGEVGRLLGTERPIVSELRVVTTPIEYMIRSAVRRARQQRLKDDEWILQHVIEFARAIEDCVEEKIGQRPFALGALGYEAAQGVNWERQTYLAALPEILRTTRHLQGDISVALTDGGLDLESLSVVSHLLASIATEDAGVDLQDNDGTLEDISPFRLCSDGGRVIPYRSRGTRVSVSFGTPGFLISHGGGYRPDRPEVSIALGMSGAGFLQRAVESARHENLSDVARSVRWATRTQLRIAESIRCRMTARMRSYGEDIDDKDGFIDPSVVGGPGRDDDGRPNESIVEAVRGLGIPPEGSGTSGGLAFLSAELQRSANSAVADLGGLSGLISSPSIDAGMHDLVCAEELDYRSLLHLGAALVSPLDLIPLHFGDAEDIPQLERSIAGVLLDLGAGAFPGVSRRVTRLVPVPFASAPDRQVALFQGNRCLGLSPIIEVPQGNRHSGRSFAWRLGRILPFPRG